jgi:hypothetical protein
VCVLLEEERSASFFSSVSRVLQAGTGVLEASLQPFFPPDGFMLAHLPL